MEDNADEKGRRKIEKMEKKKMLVDMDREEKKEKIHGERRVGKGKGRKKKKKLEKERNEK